MLNGGQPGVTSMHEAHRPLCTFSWGQVADGVVPSGLSSAPPTTCHDHDAFRDDRGARAARAARACEGQGPGLAVWAHLPIQLLGVQTLADTPQLTDMWMDMGGEDLTVSALTFEPCGPVLRIRISAEFNGIAWSR